jgi:hypothetical protein
MPAIKRLLGDALADAPAGAKEYDLHSFCILLASLIAHEPHRA